MTQTLQLQLGDCIAVLKAKPDKSVDAFIMDPPYDLTSVSRGGSSRVAGTGPYGRHTIGTKSKGGFMGKDWDGTGIAFSAEFWNEVFRVLVPGGIVKAFSGSRTFHRMAAAMELAGLVLNPAKPMESWNYGSGFPKSKNPWKDCRVDVEAQLRAQGVQGEIRWKLNV